MREAVTWTFDGHGMLPANDRAQRLAEKLYVAGQNYDLVEDEGRSSASHRHLFAIVQEAWLNLPEPLAKRFPSAEHLRKYCLIKAGFCHSESLACASEDAARQVAAFTRPVDPFSVLVVKGDTLTRYTAESQSSKSMGKERFQASKEAVIRILAEMIGVDQSQLLQARAA